MKDENWIIWNPANIEEGPAFSVEVIQNDEVTRFSVDCESRGIDILFYGLVPMYTYSLEGIRTLTWATVQEKKMDKFFFRKWFLYKVENSDFLSWAIKESCGYYSEAELTHYCIVTERDVIDILAMSEPEIVVK